MLLLVYINITAITGTNSTTRTHPQDLTVDYGIGRVLRQSQSPKQSGDITIRTLRTYLTT